MGFWNWLVQGDLDKDLEGSFARLEAKCLLLQKTADERAVDIIDLGQILAEAKEQVQALRAAVDMWKQRCDTADNQRDSVQRQLDEACVSNSALRKTLEKNAKAAQQELLDRQIKVSGIATMLAQLCPPKVKEFDYARTEAD